MSPSTPKFKSREAKDALASLKDIFDARALASVITDGLDRRATEQICAKIKPKPGAPRGARLKDLERSKLVEGAAEAFYDDEEIAYQVLKELDRACSKERHIVASIPEAQAADRMGSYRAMALKRERARMTWALARDERAVVREIANGVIAKTLDDAAQLEAAKQALDGGDESQIDGLELAKKLEEQAGRLTEAAVRVSSLESKVSKFEEERARLLAQMGSKERSLRQESEAREQLDDQLSSLRAQLSDLERREQQAQQAIAAEAEARQTAEELQQKIRRLSKLAGASKSLSALQEELDREKRQHEELERRAQHAEAETQRAAEAHEREQAKLRTELEELREELKVARRRIAELERKVPFEAELEDGPEEETLAVLLDQANLAATAFMAHRRKVNFAGLLDHLSAGKKRRRAIAFVVDNGGVHFDAFCETLRRSGWDLRLKKPKHFQDGTTKADWDMGIAVEAVELRGQVKTVALVSGDGDFAPLVKLLKRWGMRVEVAAFVEGLASDLQNAADSVTLLGTESLE